MSAAVKLNEAEVREHVQHLADPGKRETALHILTEKREAIIDLAPMLWNGNGTLASLLQEIISIYPLLSPPILSRHASNRVCNALALLQCVAAHQETRSQFLEARIPLYLYPFLNTVSMTRPFEYLRLTSLGVIGALVKVDEPAVIEFFLQAQIIPLCLRIMKIGSELSKTVATFILQRVLLDDKGLTHICDSTDTLHAISNVLSNMVTSLIGEPSARLLKHVIRCYVRLSDNNCARETLHRTLPEQLNENTFRNLLKSDQYTKEYLMHLLHQVGRPVLLDQEETTAQKM